MSAMPYCGSYFDEECEPNWKQAEEWLRERFWVNPPRRLILLGVPPPGEDFYRQIADALLGPDVPVDITPWSLEYPKRKEKGRDE